MAIFAAAVLIAINEASFHESTLAADKFAEAELARQSVGQVVHTLLEAETSLRDFLLTGQARDLAPYEAALSQLEKDLAQLKILLSGNPADMADFELMLDRINRKKTELARTVEIRKTSTDDAWRLMLSGDEGKEHMRAIRQQSEKLMLSSRLKIQAAHDKINRSVMLSRIGIAAMALGALLAFYMYLMQTEALLNAGLREQRALQDQRDRLEEKVRDRTARLAQLATRLQEVREDERGHLARELHDELGALLTAAKLDVARIKSRLGSSQPEAIERLEHLTSTLNSGIALKRRIVEDLRPSSLAHLGLVASLEILSREFAESSGLTLETMLAPVDLNESAQLTVYRLVQESLTNMGKYAMASHAQIRLQPIDETVVVEVIDDGRGFDLDQVALTNHGLAGMRHRVEAAGGRLVIKTSPGKGTHIRAELPKTSKT